MSKKYALVYQMGKVASSAICNSFKNHEQYRALHTHFLSLYGKKKLVKFCFKESLPKDYNESMRQQFRIVKNIRAKLETYKKKLSVITIVRDPIAVIVSSFFERHELFSIDKLSIRKDKNKPKRAISLKQLQDKFLDHIFNYNSIPEKIDFIGRARYFYLQFPLTFIKDELGRTCDINIYNIPLNKKDLYYIYDCNKYKILLLKYENMFSHLETTINKFLNIKDFKLLDVKSARGSHLYYHYNDFVKSLVISEEILEYYYSSEYMRHFYSRKEIEKFKERWSAKC